MDVDNFRKSLLIYIISDIIGRNHMSTERLAPASSMKRIFTNDGVLLLPILAWNVLFFSQLPESFQSETFWKDIPPAVAFGENFFRILVFSLPFLLYLRLNSQRQRTGLVVYLIGLVIYCASWLPLILIPDSAWSTSLLGWMAPAYTPMIWIAGIAMLTEKSYISVPYKWWAYLVVGGVFLVFHCLHAFTVYSRIY